MNKRSTDNITVQTSQNGEEGKSVRGKVSAVISVYNEEKNIARCLKSLSFADEIVVVDNSSTDKTTEVAKQYTTKVFTQKNNPAEIDLQKNFGFEKATNEWILSIDADEEVSKTLAEEITRVLKNHQSSIINHQSVAGYWIPRKNIIFGKFIENTGWYPDPQLRLFEKGKGKYVKAHVHEAIKLEGESAYLKEFLIHHHYETIMQFIRRTVDIYAPNEAKDYLEKGYQFSYFDAIRFPLNEFISRFFARKGYKDGFHGLMLSLLMAFYHFLIFAYLWEQQGFKEYDKQDFLKDTENEFKRAGREILYWVSKEKLESLKSPLRRNLQKISNKFRGI
jgi:glycosyltransferase involved in cell wall biosynthesis